MREGRWGCHFRRHAPLGAVLLLFVLLAGVTGRQTPPFEGPDEPQHFAYAVWLAQGRGFPPQGEAAWETPVQQEASQPPLYYWLASLPVRLVGDTGPPAVYRPNPHPVGPFPREFADNDNRAIHYPTDTQPWRGGWLGLLLARGVTTLFGLLLVVSAYGLARQVWPGADRRAWAAALLVAFTPQVIYLSSVVSNDVPVAATGALTLWLLLRLLRRPPTAAAALATGAAFGLAALSKTSGLALAAPIAVALGAGWWTGVFSRRQAGRAAGLSAVAAAAVGGWWYARAWWLYGTPLGLDVHEAAWWAIQDSAAVGSFWSRWWEVFRSFWAWFGWGTVRPPFRLYSLLLALVVLAAAGLLLAAWRWQRRRSATPVAATGALAWLVLAVAVLAVAVSLEAWMHRVIAPYGRLMYPAAGAIVLLLVAGWSALHPRFPVLPLAVLAATSLAAPAVTIPRAFAPPAPLSAADLAALPPAPGWTFALDTSRPVAELLAAIPARRSAVAGELVTVRVCWRVLARTPQDLSYFVQLIGPDNSLVASRHTYPGLGNLPTTVWTPGLVFCDPVLLPTPADLAVTRRYLVEVGMLDGDRRLPAFGDQGAPLASTFAAAVRLAAPGGPPLSPADLGGAESIQLLSSDMAPDWTRGREAALTLRWGVAAAVDADYQVFVHLRRPETDELLAQADGPPADGWYPTSWWEPGEIVVDRRTVPVPADLAPGPYRLVVGLYDLETGAVLGPPYDLGLITVQP